MKIHAIFLFKNNKYWLDKLIRSISETEVLLNDKDLMQKLRAMSPKIEHTSDSWQDVLTNIENAGEIVVVFGLYSRWWTRAIAYEQNGAVYFNTRKESRGAGSVWNVMHEVLHVLGYHHLGNSPSGNEHSIPYLVPELIKKVKGL